MPSQNMLPKGKRRKSVKAEYRAARTVAQEREAAAKAAGEEVRRVVQRSIDVPTHVSPWKDDPTLSTEGPDGGKFPQMTQEGPRYVAPYVFEDEAPEIQTLDELEAEDGVRSLTAQPEAAGMRVDAYLAKALPDVSRARVQLLTENGQVSVDGKVVKSKLKLKGGELIEIEGEPKVEPLNAVPEDIPLEVVYEDDDLAVVNKPAGMMVHAGSGSAEHNKGTLVNALLHYFGQGLSQVGGDLRPGIVHRLDKQTSGLIVVAKNDATHRKLGEMFADRRMKKTYLALVHGWMEKDEGTVQLPISRDLLRRIRMTTKRAGGRTAVSHWKVLRRVNGAYGKFTLVEVRIETGRTHQIRVHMAAVGHAVVGDYLYGAPHRIRKPGVSNAEDEGVGLERNFLHAAELEFAHPKTKKMVALKSELPAELVGMLALLEG